MNSAKHTRALLFFMLSAILFLNPAQKDVFGQASIRFAAVGDFGDTPPNSGRVATLIQNWAPDFVITVGDNNYTNPTPVPPNHYPAWDGAVGQYYHQFIKYPAGSGSAWAGSGSATNKFFPALGNHDWDAGITGWNSYFELPGNERYYDYVRGPVHCFVIDSDPRETDGITSGSVQGQWLQTQLAASASPWKIVYFHHPPYSSGSTHGNTPSLQWPFQTWGATAVIAGHDHTYERILKSGFPYFVCGLGGRSLYAFNPAPEAGSVVRYNANYGAMLIEANADTITFKSYSIAGGSTLIDTYAIAMLTGVEEQAVPKEFVLKQNYPNPFNPTTSIEFHLPKATDVTLKIYNVLGSEVMSILSNAKMGSGVHKVNVNASRLSSGLYIYRMTTPEFKFERKMVLLK